MNKVNPLYLFVPFMLFIFCQCFYERQLTIARSYQRIHPRLYSTINHPIELTLRLDADNVKLLRHLFCDLFRSSVLFWNTTLNGGFMVILDSGDSGNNLLRKALIEIPHTFQINEEPEPPLEIRGKVRNLSSDKNSYASYGYFRQLYSTFLFDLYTDAYIIALTDSDTTFTMPVMKNSIWNEKGQLIAKGMRRNGCRWTKMWKKSTEQALNRPMVVDFMSYYPAYILKSTFRNCREYLKLLHKMNSFENIFYKLLAGNTKISTINIIMNYAYHFEHDSYEWHFDMGPNTNLTKYNEKLKQPILMSDLRPEPITTVHSKHFNKEKKRPFPLEIAVCYTKIELGMETNAVCKPFYSQFDEIPFLFEETDDPYISWCKTKSDIENCNMTLARKYRTYKKAVERNLWTFDTALVKKVEQVFSKYYNMNCSKLQL